MRSALLVAAVSTLLAVPLSAQEPAEDESRAEPRPRLQVLHDPYDLAAYYRGGGSGYGTAQQLAARYPIASYYRGEAGGRSRTGWDSEAGCPCAWGRASGGYEGRRHFRSRFTPRAFGADEASLAAGPGPATAPR